MANSAYPDDLRPATWAKKKPPLHEDSELPDQLEALHKKHGAIDWELFEPDWPDKIKTIVELKKAFTLRQRLWTGKVAALEKSAVAVAADAQREGRKKTAGKTEAEAGSDIPAAVKAYGKAIDKVEAQFEAAFDKAMNVLEEKAAEEEESDHLLMDPDELQQQLARCKRNPQRKVHFGFVDETDKHAAVLALSLKTQGRKIFSVLQKEAGAKAGSYGRAWIQDKLLVLEQDKPLAGLPKKVRAAVKAAGFRVANVILYDENGKEFDRDDD